MVKEYGRLQHAGITVAAVREQSSVQDGVVFVKKRMIPILIVADFPQQRGCLTRSFPAPSSIWARPFKIPNEEKKLGSWRR